MSSGSAAFKAAAVAAVLALLVLPSLGRCPSLGPAPPPPAPPAPAPPPPAPAPVPAPAPGPTSPLSCSACIAPLVPACSPKCDAYMAAACSSSCDPKPACVECRSRVSNCTACCDDGTCSCDCKTAGDYDCRGACYDLYKGCQDCKQMESLRCMGDCLRDCSATCAKDHS